MSTLWNTEYIPAGLRLACPTCHQPRQTFTNTPCRGLCGFTREELIANPRLPGTITQTHWHVACEPCRLYWVERSAEALHAIRFRRRKSDWPDWRIIIVTGLLSLIVLVAAAFLALHVAA